MITPTSTTQLQPLYSGQTGIAAEQSSSALSSDFETFLKMLTVQMENQDPLNPVDSADYAVQLATFSSVEQQVLTNDLLTSLAASMSGGGIGALGQWVGMDVRAGVAAHFDGDPIELVMPEYQDADRRVLVIRDESGEIATRLDIPVTGADYSWDGLLADGTTAESGIYQFSIETFKDGSLRSTDAASPYNRVREALIENGQTLLLLEGDIIVTPSEVSGLRSPNSP
ncbi:MAG: flagellar hook capping FlgD N-terminal domain-containing protein [Planktotalea sp.]|uniref:flagellar hook capping FlgD N-terminal domain-containing protein n=1 Tax=Planktotalea sp. TaxID=2029877 RepID=UPI003C71D037